MIVLRAVAEVRGIAPEVLVRDLLQGMLAGGGGGKNGPADGPEMRVERRKLALIRGGRR